MTVTAALSDRRADFPPFRSPRRPSRGRAGPPASSTYIVCASPRTGSTLLCSGLIRSGMAGRPTENFDDRPDIDASYKAKLGVEDDVAYFDAVMRRASTPNGVRGLKVHWHQRPILERVVRAAHAAQVETRPDLDFDDFQAEAFGPVRWLWLRRRDKVAQGVSLFRASRSHVWHHPKNQERRGDDAALEYDFAKIDFLVHACFKYDANWGKYFAEHGISALTLWYEDFSDQYETTMRGVLDFLGHPAAPVHPPGLNRLSGSQSAEWVARYRADKMKQVMGVGGGGGRGRLPLQVTP